MTTISNLRGLQLLQKHHKVLKTAVFAGDSSLFEITRSPQGSHKVGGFSLKVEVIDAVFPSEDGVKGC
jgi:hypothetical protein